MESESIFEGKSNFGRRLVLLLKRGPPSCIASTFEIYYLRGRFCKTFLHQFFIVKKWANPGLYFCLFSSFQHITIKIQYYIDKCVYGVLGIRTLGGRMEGADESTEFV